MGPPKPNSAQMKASSKAQTKWWQDVEMTGKAPGGPNAKPSVPAKKAVTATAAKKAAYEKRLRPFNPTAPGAAKKPLPAKPSTSAKKFR